MEAVGTLAGGIAHDFNNLLQAIVGYTDLLLMQKGEEDPDRKRLKVIQQAARRRDQSLGYSRSAGRENSVPVP